jgi:hypothetical protein
MYPPLNVMKIIRLFFLFGAFSLVLQTAHAQSKIDWAGLPSAPLEEVRQIVQGINIGADAGKFEKYVLESNRMDLIGVSCLNRAVEQFLLEDIEKMPSDSKKVQILLLMLRTEETDAWPDSPFFGNHGQTMLTLSFLPLVKKFVPDTPLDYVEAISSHEKRLKLAGALEAAALKAGVVLPATAKTAPPSIRLGAPAATPQAPTTLKATPASPAIAANNAPTASSAWLMWGVVIAAVAFGLFWIARQKKK